MELFLEGKLETDEQKAHREENEKIRAKQDENGVRLTVLEQCRILKLSRATYYECCRFEAERQKKRVEENKIMLKRAKTVIHERSTNSTYGYKKMLSKHLKRHGNDWTEEKLIRNLYKELGIKGQKPVFKTIRSGKACSVA